MSYIDRLKALITKKGGSTTGLKTISDCIGALEQLENKPVPRPQPRFHEEKKSEE